MLSKRVQLVGRLFKNKLPSLISSYVEKNGSKSFSDINNASDIEEEIIKQINTLKPFDMEPYKDIPKKNFALEEENKRQQKINLAPLDRIVNIDWRKCGCECKTMAAFAERFCLFLRLKSRSAVVQIERPRTLF